MTYCFDLDGTLCTVAAQYADAEPYSERIAVVNKLFDEGHEIIIDTARAFVFKSKQQEYYALTARQLRGWGVKYHHLRVGEKVVADRYIDDKALSDKDFFGD